MNQTWPNATRCGSIPPNLGPSSGLHYIARPKTAGRRSDSYAETRWSACGQLGSAPKGTRSMRSRSGVELGLKWPVWGTGFGEPQIWRSTRVGGFPRGRASPPRDIADAKLRGAKLAPGPKAPSSKAHFSTGEKMSLRASRNRPTTGPSRTSTGRIHRKNLPESAKLSERWPNPCHDWQVRRAEVAKVA